MSEFTNRRGVNLVESESLKLEWFFREQEKSDQGIDAHVEKAPGEVGTGRLLALQIKSGPSYFKATEDGWVFRFDAKKAALWLGHALPVLVVLVDVEGCVAYWQRISNETVTSTGKGFKVEVPRSQTLATADTEWTHIASGLESRAISRYDFAISQLPPSAREIIESSEPVEHGDAAVLALHLAEGRSNPRGTVEALLAMSPGWITRHGPKAWKAIAVYAAEHDHLDLSAEAFERAAAVTPATSGLLLAAAAIHILPTDRARSETLFAKADATGQVPLVVEVIKTLLAHPEGDAAPRSVPPILTSDSDAIRSNQLVQSFLSDQANRANDFDEAVRHARLAFDLNEQDSGLMIALAGALVRRSGSVRRRVDDVSVAISLLERALDQRRCWAGPTIGIVIALVQAYAISGQFDHMLRCCLPPPQGTATADEAENTEIRRHALYAAHFAGRQDLIHGLAACLDITVKDRIAKHRTGVLRLSLDEERALFAEDLIRAVAEDDHENIVVDVVALASYGQDERSRLAPLIARSIVPPAFLDLADALLTAHTNLDAAVPALRSLGRRNLISAEHLILAMDAAARYTDAAQACAMAYEHSEDPRFLLHRAKYLIKGNTDDAEEAAREAVNLTSDFLSERADLLTYLGSRAANRDAWHVAERDLAEVVRLRTKPSSTEVWRLVVALLKLGKVHPAAAVITEHRPVVETLDELDLWTKANAMSVWDQAKASEALVLARRFNDPKLSTALLHIIVTQTHGIDDTTDPSTAEPNSDIDANLNARQRLAQATVSADLHRQAYAALDELASTFGEQSGITIIRGNPEQQVAQMSAIMQETAAAATTADIVKDLTNAALDARLPRGFAATFRGQGYATLLIRRTLGGLVSGAADDAEHDLEVQAAEMAIGQPVVVEAASLLVLSGMSSPARLEGQFPMIQIPAGALRDIYRATFDIRGLASSPGTMGWDPQLGSLFIQEYDDDEFTRQLRRAQALEDLAERLAVRTVSDDSDFDALGRDPNHAAWLEPVRLAHAQGLALWSDDLGLRRLARQSGVTCFGTPALIDALRDRGLKNAHTAEAQDGILWQTAAANTELAADFVVDVALHLDDLIQLADRDNWTPGSAALVLSRASWWAWQPSPIMDLMNLYEQISIHRADSLGDWQYAAMFGAARAYRPSDVAARMLAVIALLAYGREQTTRVIADGVRRARKVAEELGVPDPLAQIPAAAVSLNKAGKCSDPEATIAAVMAAFSDRDQPAGG